MDFVALEIFCAVAAEGSVTRAAQRLQRVQSNVTTRVRQLEDAVGCTLFLREGKRMALTPEGQTLLAYAQRLLALAEEARQALQPSQPQGRLRLGAMESTAASRLPGPLAQFHGQWPGVALELSTGASQDLLDRLRAHLPQAHSLLMDRATLLEHQSLWGQEPADKRCNANLNRLTEAEQALYRELREDHLGERLRLEQEHVRFGWLQQALQGL